jgi:predicted phosphodiesterase
MVTKRNSTLVLACLLLVLLCTACQAGQAGARLVVVKGPYLGNVTPSSIAVVWETSQPSDSRVDYGPTRDYVRHDHDSILTAIHKVTLSALTANTTYHYRVSSARSRQVASSDDGTFQTAAVPGTAVRFAVYGDTRSSPQDHAAVARGIAASGSRFVIHTGDFVSDGSDYAQWQREYFGPAAVMLRSMPLFPCLGNHERNSEWYYRFFATPDGGGDHGEQWYSFDYGDAHLIVIDTDADFAPGSAQYTWLQKDLQSARAEWLFVVHHHPAYSSGIHGGDRRVQQYLVPLYEANKVDMVFSGHDHLYERSYKAGVYYIVSGGGGAPLSEVGVTPNPYQQYVSRVHHFCTVDVSGKTATLEAHSSDGAAFDSVVTHHGPEASNRTASSVRR